MPGHAEEGPIVGTLVRLSGPDAAASP